MVWTPSHMYSLLPLCALSFKLCTVECAPADGVSLNKTTPADSGELFDLSKIHTLNDTEFDRNYFRIIRTFRKLGPESLKFINRTDLIGTGFSKNSMESSAEFRVRWESVCDHFKMDGTQAFFKNFVLQRLYQPPPAVKPPKEPPTHVRTLLDTEDAVRAKKK